MRIYLVRKEDLAKNQMADLDARLQNCIQLEGACGPINAWYAYKHFLYAFVLLETQTPIAIAEASGRPVSAPGWWIAPEHRGQGYGNELVDLLATYLKADGVTQISSIPIQTPGGKYDEQSSRLVARLRRQFQ